MPLLTVQRAALAFGHWPLLDGAELVLDAGERLGLIGRNGAGKSSLFAVLSGAAKLDDGELWRAPEAKFASVPQEPVFAPGATVFEAVAEGLGALRQVLLDYHHCTQAMGQGDAESLQRLSALQLALEAGDGWRFNSLVESTLSQLELAPDVLVETLSGGRKKRVALARALVAEPDVLLLDEPTNHLDIASIEWLEQLLLNFNGAVLFITHDRQFLDRIATGIVELDRGRLRRYPGNFTAYQQRKAEQLEVEAIHNAKFDKFWKQEEVWIRKGIEARRTRNEGRVRRLQELRRTRSERRNVLGQVKMQLDAGEQSGKLVAELEHVSFSYPGTATALVQNYSTQIKRGDRIGLIGPNGVGKTTLLKLILGELQANSGRIRLGTNLQVAYFDQFREQLDPEKSLIDTISPGSDFIEIRGEKKHVISYLEDFLFSPERARSPVRSLSGGERNRLLLARLFARPANVLVLDEPTNDLDIDTLELLEALLLEYTGTVFLVSHDRMFLDNVVSSVIAFEGAGRWFDYVGGYSDWVAYQRTRQPAATPLIKKDSVEHKTMQAARRRSTKLSFNEQRELEQLPAKMAALETEQSELQQQLLDPEIYRKDPKQAIAWQQRNDQIEEELLTLLERWETLEAKGQTQ